MKTFKRDDGTELRVVPGFRERALAYRAAVTPRESWSDSDYAEAAARKRKRFARIARKAQQFGFEPDGNDVLDVGCGDGSNCLLFAERGAAVEGIDLQPALLLAGEKSDRARRLAMHLLGTPEEKFETALGRLPIKFQEMDATRMSFADATFHFVMSRSAMEHVRPVERMLSEVIRVTRPGGLIYLSIDPFYWVRGCHKRGVVDIPFAHARLTLPEFRRFVAETESEPIAAKRTERLETLNRFPLTEWKARVEAAGAEILEWTEDPSALGETVLQENPDVLETLLPGVTDRDLLHERIKVWLRRRA